MQVNLSTQPQITGASDALDTIRRSVARATDFTGAGLHGVLERAEDGDVQDLRREPLRSR